MTENQTHYHLKIEKHVLMTAVFTAILAAGLFFTLTQIEQVQTVKQQAAEPSTNTQPVPGEVCNGQTKLTPEEAIKLSGFCPEADPVPGENLCKNFCTKAENANSEKCQPAKDGKPAGIYHCASTNGKCGAAGSCQNGEAEGYCSAAEGGTCCKNPPPPPPPPPPAAPAKTVVAPRVAPRAVPKAPPSALARCKATCKTTCSNAGRCIKPSSGTAGGTTCIAVGQPYKAGASCCSGRSKSYPNSKGEPQLFCD